MTTLRPQDVYFPEPKDLSMSDSASVGSDWLIQIYVDRPAPIASVPIGPRGYPLEFGKEGRCQNAHPRKILSVLTPRLRLMIQQRALSQRGELGTFAHFPEHSP